MVFNSYIFILVFLPLVVTGYFGLNRFCYGKSGQAGLLWLLVSSCIFYAFEAPVFLLFLIFNIIINHILGKRLCLGNKTRNGLGQGKKLLLFVGILANLLPLVYFKYSNFLLETIGDFSNKEWKMDIALPLGISFITFQQIAYLVDCYRNAEGNKDSFLEYATYVAFFPKITMGPIALHAEIVPQFREQKRKSVDYQNLSMGLYAFGLGLAKKVLIADVLAKMVNVGFQDIEFLNAADTLMVMLCYTLQLYFDFSGYCDMAVGVAKMLNIDLPYNFNSPYKAKSITEFWDRWHMTLTRFFTRYVYIPLGGSRRGRIRTYINVLIIFLLSGIWHGAAWNFVFWGLLHGILMVIERIGREFFSKDKKTQGVLGRVFVGIRWFVNFCIINVTWVFFRAKSVKEATGFLGNVFGGGWQLSHTFTEMVNDLIEIRLLSRLGLSTVFNNMGSWLIWIILAIMILAVIGTKNTQEKMETGKYTWRRSLVTVVLIVWSVISLSDVSVFLYFNF